MQFLKSHNPRARIDIAEVLSEIETRLADLNKDIALVEGTSPHASLTALMANRDPHLKALKHEKYKAEQDYQRIRGAHGDDAPMLDVAEYTRDSLECQYTARLLELSHDALFMRRVKAEKAKLDADKEAQEDYRRGLLARQEEMRAERIQLERMQARLKAEQEGGSSMILVWVLMMYWSGYAHKKGMAAEFNRTIARYALVQAFARA